MIGIIDYGMGNIHSVKKALESFGQKTSVINSQEKLKDCDKIVLPGVGAFDDAVSQLRSRSIVDPLIEFINSKKIFLGICLGMQILFEKSQEAKKEKGLGVIRGEVRKFQENSGLKVPHMGWNQLDIRQGDCPLLKGVSSADFVYFCHSYYVVPKEEKIVAASTEYGSPFCSVAFCENIYGVQFHPEKSQDVGMKILENFVKKI